MRAKLKGIRMNNMKISYVYILNKEKYKTTVYNNIYINTCKQQVWHSFVNPEYQLSLHDMKIFQAGLAELPHTTSPQGRVSSQLHYRCVDLVYSILYILYSPRKHLGESVGRKKEENNGFVRLCSVW